ncbi:MAG: HAMP domain-containing protein [Deferribacteres bacterium]|nr:HAMP domain-containing protein [candidate division KSB1 bacterium]MCB9508784.1 HAMP domain-containing protein [Deferribacteres bacterium]
MKNPTDTQSPDLKIRSPLRRKVLLPVATMIIVMITVALFVVNKVVHNQVQQEVTNDLKQKLRAFDSLQRGQQELLAQRAVVLAETPHLRAAIETFHPETIQRELTRIISSRTDSLVLILDPQEHTLATFGENTSDIAAFPLDQFFAQKAIAGAQLGIAIVGNAFWQVALAPVLMPAMVGGSVHVGYIVIGFPIDPAYLNHLEQVIGCHFAFYQDRDVLRSSSGIPAETARTTFAQFRSTATSDQQVEVLETKSGELLVGEWQLAPEAKFGYILAIPFESIFQEIVEPVERTILVVAALALAAAILISYFISRQVVFPVQKLVSATEAVMAGDYAHPIAVDAQDEIGYLAEKFDTMRQALQKQMKTLATKNDELQQALQMLEKTQQDLVQSEKLAATGKITAQLSHELNNPIHNVQSCLERARRKIGDSQKANEYLDLAHTEIVRMGKLVRQMLDFYRPAAYEREMVAINAIIEQVLQASQQRFEESAVSIATTLDPLLPKVSASSDQLKQVFLNLTSNALDAMPDGGQLEICTHAQNGQLEIHFKDTGIGIAEDQIGNIFDAFYTTKSRASGVGLGLSVSYGIIKSHGGKISAHSQPGKGAQFTIQLPAATGRS